MKDISNLYLGEKKILLHGDYLRYKNSEIENNEVLISKINSIVITKFKNQYNNLFWSGTGFSASLVSWFFLEENFFSTVLSIICLISAIFFLLAYFLISNYFLLEIKSTNNIIKIEFPFYKMNLVEKFKKVLIQRI
ncbi:MAG: hypothetical protein GWO78_00910 [Dehalococcoidales bacterium]|jgi:hypothetical protein|nr:hypothetical protein [Dehalococcoidales bacterium]